MRLTVACEVDIGNYLIDPIRLREYELFFGLFDSLKIKKLDMLLKKTQKSYQIQIMLTIISVSTIETDPREFL